MINKKKKEPDYQGIIVKKFRKIFFCLLLI